MTVITKKNILIEDFEFTLYDSEGYTGMYTRIKIDIEDEPTYQDITVYSTLKYDDEIITKINSLGGLKDKNALSIIRNGTYLNEDANSKYFEDTYKVSPDFEEFIEETQKHLDYHLKEVMLDYHNYAQYFLR